jgi:dihydroorotate dehydrogenase
MYQLSKSLLFRMDPEQAHYFTMRWFMRALKVPGMRSILEKEFSYEHPSLERNIAGLRFKNPIGLAAGFDKNAHFLQAMAVLGFSHIEVGTVTPRPQAGNPKPRLFRLIKSEALINRMGFNNDGVDAMAERLRGPRPKDLIVGANLGKNKDTPNEEAHRDYLVCFTRLYDLVDYFTVNVSSPNTPGLRALQDKEPLTYLLRSLQYQNTAQKPVFLKIAPDLTNEQLDEIVDIVTETGINGIICTNTTISRDGLKESKAELESIGAGGMSGAPLLNRSVEVVKYMKERSQDRFTIIGVGGIHDPASAQAHLDAGADLIQVYSGFIYEGPGMIRRILKYLVR